MTATITSIAHATWTQNVRGYCFHARTSVPTSGDLWKARAAVWFVSQGGTVTKRHVGLELVHGSRATAEQIDFLLVDEAGNAEWATPVTTTVGSGYDLEYWVDATSGSDGNAGTSSGAAFQTYTALNAAIRANATAGDEVLVHWSGETHTITSPTGGFVWRPFTTAGGGTDLGIRVTYTSTSGTAVIAVNDGYGVVGMAGADASAFINDGVTFLGDYTTGGASVTTEAIGWRAQNTTSEGVNVYLFDCEITGFHAVFTAASPLIAHSYVASGQFDWLIAEGCTFGSTSAYHFNWDNGRYFGFYNCTFADSRGDSTGSSMRFARQHYMSVTGCTFDRRDNASYAGNVIRINGGNATDTWDYGQYLSFHGLRGLGLGEGFEFDGAGATSTNYVRGVWVDGCKFSMISGFFASMGGFDSNATQMDMVEVRFSNCAEQLGSASANCMFNLTLSTSASSAGKVRSLMLDGCTMHQAIPQGSFTFSQIFLQATNDVANNVVDGSIWMRSNYAHCASTTGGGSHALCWMYGSFTSAKFAASNYNIMSSAATGATFRWTETTDLATWDDSGLDVNSIQVDAATATLDMTDVTAAGFDPTPSAGTGPQVGAGMPGILHMDAGRYLRSASTPTAGSHEYSPTGLVDDPDFGGPVTGSGAATLPGLSAAGVGVMTIRGSGAATLPGLSALGSGSTTLPTRRLFGGGRHFGIRLGL